MPDLRFPQVQQRNPLPWEASAAELPVWSPVPMQSEVQPLSWWTPPIVVPEMAALVPNICGLNKHLLNFCFAPCLPTASQGLSSSSLRSPPSPLSSSAATKVRWGIIFMFTSEAVICMQVCPMMWGHLGSQTCRSFLDWHPCKPMMPMDIPVPSDNFCACVPKAQMQRFVPCSFWTPLPAG